MPDTNQLDMQIVGSWLALVQGRPVQLVLAPDGTYALAGEEGRWGTRGGRLWLYSAAGGADQQDYAVRDDSLTLTSPTFGTLQLSRQQEPSTTESERRTVGADTNTPIASADPNLQSAGSRWSTPSGEISFVLPREWTARSEQANDGLALEILPPVPGARCTIVAGTLTPQERAQPKALLMQLGIRQFAQALPHLQAEPIEDLSVGGEIPAQACHMSGINPETGQRVDAWVAVAVKNDFYLKVLFEAAHTAQFEGQLTELRGLLASLKLMEAAPGAQAAIVGKWRCQYEGAYGVYVDIYTFAPDGSYQMGETGDFYFPGTGAGENGWKAGPGGFDSQSGRVGTYQVVGSTLVLNDPEKGTSTHTLRLDSGELFIQGRRFKRIG